MGVSVGVEDVADLLQDFDRAIAIAKEVTGDHSVRPFIENDFHCIEFSGVK